MRPATIILQDRHRAHAWLEVHGGTCPVAIVTTVTFSDGHADVCDGLAQLAADAREGASANAAGEGLPSCANCGRAWADHHPLSSACPSFSTVPTTRDGWPLAFTQDDLDAARLSGEGHGRRKAVEASLEAFRDAWGAFVKDGKPLDVVDRILALRVVPVETSETARKLAELAFRHSPRSVQKVPVPHVITPAPRPDYSLPPFGEERCGQPWNGSTEWFQWCSNRCAMVGSHVRTHDFEAFLSVASGRCLRCSEARVSERHPTEILHHRDWLCPTCANRETLIYDRQAHDVNGPCSMCGMLTNCQAAKINGLPERDEKGKRAIP